MKINIFICLLLLVGLSPYLTQVYADTTSDNAVNYLKIKQDATGQIMAGSTGDASPWAAIAFSANGIDTTTVKNPTNSLEDYLLNNHPTTTAPATEWEKWILAITANGQNPYDFGGVNYVSTLESSTYYNNNQIGEITSATDDWFGVLALISSGVASSDATLTNSLSFILSHQNPDGGFGYSTTAKSDGNDTAAAIQALVAAKNYSVANASLDSATANAKTYLLGTQDKSGGFNYDTNPWTTAPDSDSTTWALMALNSLGMQNSSQVNIAKTWLVSQQASDGGFQACQYNPPDYACTLASNSTTTANALIGLADKGWILEIFDTSILTSSSIKAESTPTPSIRQLTNNNSSPTPTSTPTPTPIPSSTPQPTNTPTPIESRPTPTQVPQNFAEVIDSPTPIPTTAPRQTSEVLGVNTVNENVNNPIKRQLVFVFMGLGIVSLGVYGLQRLKN